MTTGRLFGLGVGPGDPELLTLKALRLLQAAPALAYFAAGGRKGNAYTIVEQYLRPEQELLRLQYPVTREKLPEGQGYEEVIARFYDHSAERVAALLDKGQDVAVICEGDPLFYGSYMYLHDRLAGRYDAEVVPGISSVFAGAAVLGTPLVYRNQTLSVLSGVLSEDELRTRLKASEAAVIMKLGGGNLEKARRVLGDLGLLERALYVERATMEAQRILPLAEVDAETSPYFSLILIPGRKWQS